MLTSRDASLQNAHARISLPHLRRLHRDPLRRQSARRLPRRTGHRSRPVPDHRARVQPQRNDLRHAGRGQAAQPPRAHFHAGRRARLRSPAPTGWAAARRRRRNRRGRRCRRRSARSGSARPRGCGRCRDGPAWCAGRVRPAATAAARAAGGPAFQVRIARGSAAPTPPHRPPPAGPRGRRRRCRRCRNSRLGSWPDIAGDSPRRNRRAAHP